MRFGLFGSAQAKRGGPDVDSGAGFRDFVDNNVEAEAVATRIWREINEPNLLENILPTRGRAHLILKKGPDHAVQQVRLRKL